MAAISFHGSQDQTKPNIKANVGISPAIVAANMKLHIGSAVPQTKRNSLNAAFENLENRLVEYINDDPSVNTDLVVSVEWPNTNRPQAVIATTAAALTTSSIAFVVSTTFVKSASNGNTHFISSMAEKLVECMNEELNRIKA